MPANYSKFNKRTNLIYLYAVIIILVLVFPKNSLGAEGADVQSVVEARKVARRLLNIPDGKSGEFGNSKTLQSAAEELPFTSTWATKVGNVAKGATDGQYVLELPKAELDVLRYETPFLESLGFYKGMVKLTADPEVKLKFDALLGQPREFRLTPALDPNFKLFAVEFERKLDLASQSVDRDRRDATKNSLSVSELRLRGSLKNVEVTGKVGEEVEFSFGGGSNFFERLMNPLINQVVNLFGGQSSDRPNRYNLEMRIRVPFGGSESTDRKPRQSPSSLPKETVPKRPIEPIPGEDLKSDLPGVDVPKQPVKPIPEEDFEPGVSF